MAKFEPKLEALDGLSMDFQKLGRITDEDAWTILTPAADLLQGKFMEKIRGVFQQHTGVLAAAIKSFKRKQDGPVILVYPDGPHHRYRSRKGGTKTATAAEVGFVLEYGDGHHRAAHWMESTVDEQDRAIGEAMQEGFDTLCEKKGVGL